MPNHTNGLTKVIQCHASFHASAEARIYSLKEGEINRPFAALLQSRWRSLRDGNDTARELEWKGIYRTCISYSLTNSGHQSEDFRLGALLGITGWKKKAHTAADVYLTGNLDGGVFCIRLESKFQQSHLGVKHGSYFGALILTNMLALWCLYPS